MVAGLGYALGTPFSLPGSLDTARVVALPMKNPLLSQGRVHVVSRHARVLPPAAARLLRQIVADVGALAPNRRK